MFYYETDAMGVVHHSNFLRWLEEARVNFFADIGLPYERTERLGILSPVISMNIEFKYFARFGDEFVVRLEMTKYTGTRFVIAYDVVNQLGDTLVRAQSSHAFVNRDYKPVAIKRLMPELHEQMKLHIAE